MSTLTCARGLPACGKSTYARLWVRDGDMRAIVSRDSFRQQVFGRTGMGTPEQEAAISAMEKQQARTLLKQGFDVFVDAQNLRMSYLKAWKQLAVSEGAEFDVFDLTSVDLDICRKRNAIRANPVPDDYIVSQHRKFIAGKDPISAEDVELPAPMSFLRYTKQWDLPNAYLFDVDGTLAHMSGRSPYDVTRVSEDTMDEDVATIADILWWSGMEIVVVSGRSDECRADTEKWLEDNGISYHDLFMRAAGDNRPDTVVKDEIFERNIRGKWNVMGVFDDRDSVVSMWRSKGIKCYQVDYGAF